MAMAARAANIFVRNKLTAFGGPDGGDGGRKVLILSFVEVRTYGRYCTSVIFKNVLADDGENGSKNNCTGKDGKDIIIEVPWEPLQR